MTTPEKTVQNLDAIDKWVNGDENHTQTMPDGVTARSPAKAIADIQTQADAEIEASAKNFNFTDAGFDFATGGTIETYNQLVKDANGNYWQWQGVLPHTVTAGTAPSSPDYELKVFGDHSNLSNRNLSGAHSADAIQFSWGDSLELASFNNLAWSSNKSYSPGDYAKYDGKSYRAITSSTNKKPDINSSDWEWVSYRFQDGYNQLGRVEDAINVIGGHSGNAIVPDTHSCVVLGGGLVNKENVIGGVEANVNTELSNVPSSWVLGDESQFCMIGGGYDNVVNGLANVIPVGQHCLISRAADHGTVTGGSVNWIQEGSYNSIYGGSRNTIFSDGYSIIAGGGDGYIGTTSIYSGIFGGSQNQVYASFSTISGGQQNNITATAATANIGGGSGNEIRQSNANISGGNGNTIDSTGQGCNIGGGINNSSKGECATVTGGRENEAEKNYSSASGYQSRALKVGESVLANGKFASSGDAQRCEFLMKQTTSGLENKNLELLDGSVDISTKSNLAIAFDVLIVTHDTGGNNENGMIKLKGLASKGTGGNWEINALPKEQAATAGMSGIDAQIINSVGSLRLRVSGVSGLTCRWVAHFRTVECFN